MYLCHVYSFWVNPYQCNRLTLHVGSLRLRHRILGLQPQVLDQLRKGLKYKFVKQLVPAEITGAQSIGNTIWPSIPMSQMLIISSSGTDKIGFLSYCFAYELVQSAKISILIININNSSQLAT